MERCKDCRFWEAQTWGGTHQHICVSPKLGEQVDGEDVLSYPYSEGGTFMPGPEFGCVHFEQLTVSAKETK